MRNEWRLLTFQDAPLEIIDGDRGKNYPKQSDFLQQGHCLFLNAGNVTADGFNFENCSFINQEKDTSLRKGKIERDDIVLTTRGTVGNVAFYNEKVSYDHIRINSGMVIFRPTTSEIFPRYLYLFLRSKIFKDQVQSLTTGSAQPQLPIRDINRIQLQLPPLDEQKAIAHILGTLDDKIELNQQMNRTLEAIARALFKSWFIDFDPVRAKLDGRQPAGMDAETAALFPAEFEDSALGKVPKGWRIVQVEDIASRIAMGPFGSRITSDNFVSSGVPVIRGNNLIDGFVEDRFVYLTEEKANELRSSIAYPGDIVFTHRGTLGQVGLIPESAAFPRYVVSQSQMLLSVDRQQINPRIVYYFFRSPIGQQALLANTNTTGVPSIARPSTSLKAIQIVIPPKGVSDCFDQLINLLELKREQNAQETVFLTNIRDSLLPKLLSGHLLVGGS